MFLYCILAEILPTSTPLTNLTKKTMPNRVLWTPEHEQFFVLLKNMLTSKPILRSPDPMKPFVLQTDASDTGIGAVLSQSDDDGKEHPVAFYSRKLYCHVRQDMQQWRKSALPW